MVTQTSALRVPHLPRLLCAVSNFFQKKKKKERKKERKKKKERKEIANPFMIAALLSAYRCFENSRNRFIEITKRTLEIVIYILYPR